jgi:hypothetical protein
MSGALYDAVHTELRERAGVGLDTDEPSTFGIEYDADITPERWQRLVAAVRHAGRDDD